MVKLVRVLKFGSASGLGRVWGRDTEDGIPAGAEGVVTEASLEVVTASSFLTNLANTGPRRLSMHD